MKPFIDGEFAKECMMSVVRELCPEKKGTFENISLSVRKQWHNKLKNCQRMLKRHCKIQVTATGLEPTTT